MTGVVLNALPLRPAGAGVVTYVRELLRALPQVCDEPLAAHVQRDAARVLPPGVRAITHPVEAGTRRALRGLALGDRGATVFHGLDADLPARTRAATVTTIHDMSVFDVPEAFGRYRAAGERLLLGRALRRADVVIAVSASTAERIRALTGRTAQVVPLAPAPQMCPPAPAEIERVRAAHRLPARFVLQVGTIEPRKDVDALAAACATLDVPLVLAGAIGTGSHPPPGVRHLGFVDDRDLPALYGAATVVAYVSRYEGFGLPPLEAMACGAATVATSVGGIADACRDGARLVPPGRLDPLIAALATLVDDPDERCELGHRGRARAADLSWAGTAEATAAVYRELGVGR